MGLAEPEAQTGKHPARRTSRWPAPPAGPSDPHPERVTTEQRERYLAYVREHKGCSRREACEQVGIHRKDVKLLEKTDWEFFEDYRTVRGWDDVRVIDGLVKLGLDGVEKPLVSAGKLVLYPEGHEHAGQIVMIREYDSKATIWLANAMTQEGREMLAAKLGLLEVNVNTGPVTIKPGVPLEEVAKILADAGVPLAELAVGDDQAGEVVSEEDAPLG